MSDRPLPPSKRDAERRAATKDRRRTNAARPPLGLLDAPASPRALLEAFPLPASAWRVEGGDFRLVCFNEAGAELTEGEADDLVGSTAGELYGEDSPILEDLRRCVSERALVTRHLLHRFRSSGSDRHLRLTYGFVSPGVVICCADDLTNSLAAAGALRESNERFRRLAESADDLIFVYRMLPEPCFEYVNAAALAITGYTPDEFYADPSLTFKLVHPDDHHILEQEGELDAPQIMRVVRKDGGIAWVEQRVSPVTDDAGTIVAAQGISRDITARVHAEGELRRLAHVVDSSDDAIQALDLEGRIVSWNRGAEHVYGYSAIEVIGRTPRLLVPADRADDLEAIMREVHAGRPIRLNTQRITKDGRRLDVSISASPLRDADGQVTGATLISRDNTAEVAAIREKEKLDAHLQDIERLESVGQLAGGVAHDFNNILSVILANADFAQGQMGDHPARHEIDEIQKAAGRAADLTRQLLTFSRGDVMHPEVFAPSPLVTGLESMLRRTIPESIDLELHVDDSAPAIQCDRTQFEQVVMNLVVNARDAMPDGGRLIVTAGEAEVDKQRANAEMQAGRHFLLTVADTGVGMAPRTASHIFDPFFTTKAKGQGTGLGLATLHGIVRTAGGFIDVETAPGEGSTFRVHFPAAGSEPVPNYQSAALSAKEPAHRHGTVLIVEDEEAVARATARILDRGGYETIVAAGPLEALSTLADPQQRVDLVLTDVIMPKMSGAQFADRLHEQRPTTPVVFMSGYTDSPDELAAGTFIAKPFTSGALLTAVDEALSA